MTTTRTTTAEADSPNLIGLRSFALATVAAAPLAVGPACVLVVGRDWPDWQRIVGVAIAVFAAAKWLTFATFVWHEPGQKPECHARRVAGYFLFWPGMDPRPFFVSSEGVVRPGAREWFVASAKLLAGCALIAMAARIAIAEPLVAGWTGIAGFLLALHFGSFHLMALYWRAAGVAVTQIMNAPLLATSLADFWGRRWNLAFRDLAHRFVFRPTIGPLGPAAATLLVFLMSGLAHDAVVSLPVQSGYGGPTAYFVIQGLAMLFERSRYARRIGVGRGIAGWALTMLIVFAPAGLLFHRAFVERAIVPLVHALSF